MLSLRKIIKGVLVGVIVYIILVLIINFFFVPSIKNSTNKSNLDVQNINEKILEMNLPIRVLLNIQNQVISDPTNLENQNLLDAFDSNLSKLQLLSSDIENSISLLEKDLNKFDQLTLKIYHNEINDIFMNINDTRLQIDAFSSLMVDGNMEIINLEQMTSLESLIIEEVEHLKVMNNTFNNNIINTSTWIANLLFAGMILVLLLLSFGIYKFILFDQKFILDSFKQLSDKNYDFKSLPKYNPIFAEGYQIKDQIEELFSEEKFTQNIKEVLLSSYHIDDLIQKLFDTIHSDNEIDRIGIAFVDYSRKKFIAEYGISSYTDVKLGPGFEVSFDKTSLTNLLENKQAYIDNDLEATFAKKPHSPSLKLITDENIKSNMVIPVLMGEMVFGVIFFSSSSKNFFNEKHLRVGQKLIYEISGFLNRAYFTKVILSKITGSFSELVDQKDNETGGHIRRMVSYSVVLAKGLLKKNIPGYEVNEKFVLEIERNASSHDIGKVGIPDEILKKPGKLTADEWVIMRTHTTIGADIFKSLREGLEVFDADFYKYAEEIARYHHERFDGSGYPQGLSGEDIPLSARIVAIADVFDALNSKRHYKDAFGFEKSLEIIKDSAGSHLDPVLVEIFLDHRKELKRIANS